MGNILDNSTGYRLFPGQNPFILIKLPVGLTARDIQHELNRDLLLIRNCDNIQGLSDQFIRISLKQSNLNQVPAKRIAIETIDYPIYIIEDVIDELDFGICMDVGHLILHGHDIIRFYKRYENRISIIHLHGVRGPRDHVSLDHLPVELLESFLGLLQEYRGTISLEVFSFDILSTSLGYLAECWQSISATSRSCS